MGLVPVPWDSVSVCLSAQAILKWREYRRLVLSVLEHGDDIHLYYNMLSFLSKGRTLEHHFGSTYFAYLLTVFSVLTSATYVGLEVLLSELTHDKQHYKTCAIGFSGVIFALKVLTTHYWETGYRRYFGMRVSAKYAVWLELLAIQLMVPNASFVGHLAGILVGVMFTQGPLKFFMDLPYNALALVVHPSRPEFRNHHTNWGSGVSGRSSTSTSSAYGRADYENSHFSDADYDEAVRRSYETLREEEAAHSFRPSAPPPSYEEHHSLDPDEIRRRRLARFTANYY